MEIPFGIPEEITAEHESNQKQNTGLGSETSFLFRLYERVANWAGSHISAQW
jgi:hypothetical protein